MPVTLISSAFASVNLISLQCDEGSCLISFIILAIACADFDGLLKLKLAMTLSIIFSICPAFMRDQLVLIPANISLGSFGMSPLRSCKYSSLVPLVAVLPIPWQTC